MKMLKQRLKIYLITFIIAMLLGISGFINFENLAITDAVYYSIVTVSTVGYGDIHPNTNIGKMLAVFLIVMGVGTFLGIIANTTEMMLNRREQLTLQRKMSLLIGVFFSEVGIKLIRIFCQYDLNLAGINSDLIIKKEWADKDFNTLTKKLKQHGHKIDMSGININELSGLLFSKRNFMITLFENPTLLEHDKFTNLLRAAFHLTEELAYRKEHKELPQSDRDHIGGDISRVYSSLLVEWVDYMRYLKNDYPYLFSHAVRSNPFDKNASIVVK